MAGILIVDDDDAALLRLRLRLRLLTMRLLAEGHEVLAAASGKSARARLDHELTPEVRAAWAGAYDLLSEVMQRGAMQPAVA
ncbi:MAG: hypothetical protein Q8R69_25395 [Telluria sp.]|nr:hypothetical protein [Telluria sp.]